LVTLPRKTEYSKTKTHSLGGSEMWVTMQRDLTHLEAAEMRFLRSVTGYTRLDEIRSEDIRQELEISGIQDVRLKYKQNWINHLKRMDNTRLPKYVLTYKPRAKKGWQKLQEMMAMRRYRNRSNDLIHGAR